MGIDLGENGHGWKELVHQPHGGRRLASRNWIYWSSYWMWLRRRHSVTESQNSSIWIKNVDFFFFFSMKKRTFQSYVVICLKNGTFLTEGCIVEKGSWCSKNDIGRKGGSKVVIAEFLGKIVKLKNEEKVLERKVVVAIIAGGVECCRGICVCVSRS